MIPTVVPTLDEIRAHPETAQGLPAATRQALALQALTVLAALAAVPAEPNGQPAPPGEGDRLLDVAEVAARLGRSRDYVYRRAWDFEVKGLGRGRRFSAQALDRYLHRRQGR